MKEPVDFLGLNIYASKACRRSVAGQPEIVPWPPGYPRSGVDWQPIVPQALYWGPRFLYERYRLPISITENGLSTRDQVFLDGQVHDPHRVDYLQRGLSELGRAIRDGVPVRSYHHWSLLDNFEWADGYKQRFGLVYVDYRSQKRMPKDSYRFYQQLIASNGRAILGAASARDAGRSGVTWRGNCAPRRGRSRVGGPLGVRAPANAGFDAFRWRHAERHPSFR
jgi:beta-glucosidase